VRRLGPALVLLAYGAAFSAAAVGRGLPAFDDHPGQYFRLWHALERSLPEGRWTADWNPDWWGGYPELQFYPPGFALAGALIRLVGLWQPSVELVYQLLCALTLLLPALTTFALLAVVLGDGWLALPPAFLALTLSAGLRAGVEESLRWGMLTSRLATACLPLLALSLRPWIASGRPPVWAPPVAAAAILAHPASAPTVVMMLGVAALFAVARASGRAALRQAATAAGLAFVLTAFWSLPLLLRRGWLVPLAWGHPDGTPSLAGVPTSPLLYGLGAAALAAWIPALRRRRPFDVFLAVLPVALAGGAALNAALFAREWSVIEPARLADGVVAATLWADGLAFGDLAGHLARRPRHAGRPILALGVAGLLAMAPGRVHGEPALTLWPRAAQWPTSRDVATAHDLDRLWTALRGKPDRVLFATSSLRLGRDPAWHAPHSHVTSLAPILAGREIVHGTYTHPSPLAARFYTGAPTPPRRLPQLAEQLDGQRLLGQPWERLAPEAFDAFARRLRVATVVVPATLASRALFLGEHYVRSTEAAGFAVYDRRDRPWPQLERLTHRRYRVLISPAGGVWIPSGIPAYPLWQAKSRQGILETRVDAWGLLEFRVPLDVFEAELVYAEGPLEWLSLALSALGAAAWGGWAWRSRGVAPRRPTSALERRRRPAPERWPDGPTARASGSSRSGRPRRRRGYGR